MIQRALLFLALAAFLPAVATAETATAASTPTFEAADVQPSPHSSTPFMRGGRLIGDRFFVRQGTLVDLISAAYGIDHDNILGGPAWLDLDRFDIVAKAPSSTSQDDAKLMLRTLLAERFHLVVHNDTHPLASYVLRVDKAGLKMKEADAGESPDLQEHHTPQTPAGVPAYYSITVKDMTMPRFRGVLSDFASQYLPKPVVDATGLKGGYDFDLHWTWKPAPDGLTIFDAVERQLGLKLALENYPTPVLVVDSADRKPTPDAPGIAAALPAPPPIGEFDVAIIKPSAPDEQLGLRISGGQVNITGAPLQFMIAWAWNLNPTNNEAIVGAPKDLNDRHFNILAKVAPTEDPVTGKKTTPNIDFDDLQSMIRNLITQRFKLQMHMEDRPQDAYTLVAVSPKMKKADPLMRTGCKEGPGPDGKDPRIDNPILGRLLTCTNMTMAEFGDELRYLANGYIYNPVVDGTNLTGGYDFTLSFSSIGQLRSIPPPAAAGSNSSNPSNANTASDPNGGLSLFDAISREMGLKMEKVRRPEPTMVVEHVEETPTDD